MNEPIAIVGIGCRFPGSGAGPASFWQFLCAGGDAVGEIPSDRWNRAAYADPDASKPGRMRVQRGAFLRRIDAFDAAFFGLSPREAAALDPQQRILLEVAWEALEDAGLPPDRLAGSDVGVFMGGFAMDYQLLLMSERQRDLIDIHTSVGVATGMLANRLSFMYDFRGPSVTVDTACSSSLVATHLACQSVWSGESRMALAGGVNVILKPEWMIAASKGGFLSPDGRCKAFDRSADGYGRGEGAGIVVLKPLKDARASGDRVYAVLLGTGINEDGRTFSMTQPSEMAQRALLQKVYQSAAVTPAHVPYVEAHGTGTRAGDRVEANAIGQFFSAGRPAGSPCLVGSVKTNIGHLEAGAGVAGLIKAALALYHRQIPPSLHFQEPNPDIAFPQLQLKVVDQLTPFPIYGERRLAGVNSFGFGGANAHVILAEPASAVSDPGPALSGLAAHSIDGVQRKDPVEGRPMILSLSARSEIALKALAGSFRDQFVKARAAGGPAIRDICYAAAVRRSHHAFRLAIALGPADDPATALESWLSREPIRSVHSGVVKDLARPVFVFCGMGPQTWGMGRDLLASEPVFRAVIERCDERIMAMAGWSLCREWVTSESQSRMNEPTVAQPVLFALQVALAAWWQSLGIEPAAVIGHSVGELAAAYVAGALSLDDALQVLLHRSRLQQRVAGQGGMLAAELSWAEAERLVVQRPNNVFLAAFNGPRDVTLSGDLDALRQVATELEQQQRFCRLLNVNVAYHSAFMDELKSEFLESAASIRAVFSQLPWFSSVLGARFKEAAGPDYWWRDIRDPVMFAQAVEAAKQEGHSLFLEIGPHPVLARSILMSHQSGDPALAALPSLRRQHDDRALLATTLAALYVRGCPVNWTAWCGAPRAWADLPMTPWQQERFWIESEAGRQERLDGPGRGGLGRVASGHPLLGDRLDGVWPAWESALSLTRQPFLRDHQIQGLAVYPGAALIEMMLAAGGQRQVESASAGQAVLKDVAFLQPLFMTDRDTLVQLSMNPNSGSFDIHARHEPDGKDWQCYAKGRCVWESSRLLASDGAFLDPSGLTPGSVEDEYERFSALGLNYGPAFRLLTALLVGADKATGILDAQGLDLDPSRLDWHVHPAVLDAAFQVFLSAILAGNPNAGLFLPARVGTIRYVGPSPSGPMFQCRIQVRTRNAQVANGDLWILDESGRILVEILDMEYRAVAEAQSIHPAHLSWLYAPQWDLQARDERADAAPGLPGQRWVILGDRAGLGLRLAERLRQCHESCVMVEPADTFRRVADDAFAVRPDHGPDLEQLVAAVSSPSLARVNWIHVWSLNAGAPEAMTGDSLMADQGWGAASVLALVQALAGAGLESNGLWLVTRGAQAVEPEAEPSGLTASALWGLGRVLMNEHPGLRVRMLDLDPASAAEDVDAWLRELIEARDGDREIAWRRGQRHVRRVRRLTQADLESARQQRDNPGRERVDPATAFRLETTRPGQLDHWVWRRAERLAPAAEEVEIHVQAAGVHSWDVDQALGQRRNTPPAVGAAISGFGSECSGVVSAVGSATSRFNVGDEVMALASPALSSFITTRAALVALKPAGVDLDGAAALPVAYLAAYQALIRLAHLQPGERVLVLPACDVISLAAIRLAIGLGAEVLAVTPSTERPIDLSALGPVRILDSVASAEQELRGMPAGHGVAGRGGVDVVLEIRNRPGGGPDPSVLSPGGRWVALETGEGDLLSSEEVSAWRRRASACYTVHLPSLLQGRGVVLEALWKETQAAISRISTPGLPCRIFPAARAMVAFVDRAQAREAGATLVRLADQPVWVSPPKGEPTLIRADRTYLVTGGLQGFGLATAQWLADEGARSLVLISRRGNVSAEAQGLIDRVRANGGTVQAEAVDVTDAPSVAGLLARMDKTLPPLGGLIHAATVYDDALLPNLTRKRLDAVLAPKLAGAWNLHRLTADRPLDFFVLYSSIAAIIGNPGQANYAAANAFLESLAKWRRAKGWPALVVHWGPIAEAGRLARDPHMAPYLERLGLCALPVKPALECLKAALSADWAEVGVADMDWRRWAHVWAPAHDAGLIAHPPAGGGPASPAPPGGEAWRAIQGLPREQQFEAWVRLMTKSVAAVLGLAEGARIEPARDLFDLGLDSMMAMELSARLENILGMPVPVMLLMKHRTLAQLADALLQPVQK